jgi:release factor glutamine methyltransferase
MKLAEVLAEACQILVDSPTGRLDSEVLLGHVLAVSRAHLYANPEAETSARQCDEFLQLVERRVQGEPIAYLVGHREFWSLQLKVTPDVLIPRPETELLVETALKKIPPDCKIRVADLGTGCGAIALAIASERPYCEVHSSDISNAALAVARENARMLGLQNIGFHQGSWLEPLTGRFTLIISNPPYIPRADPHLQQGDTRFEPEAALVPGPDGMTAIHRIAMDSLPVLEHGGYLIIEHGFEQGQATRSLLKSLGYQAVETKRDLADLERVTVGKNP